MKLMPYSLAFSWLAVVLVILLSPAPTPAAAPLGCTLLLDGREQTLVTPDYGQHVLCAPPGRAIRGIDGPPLADGWFLAPVQHSPTRLRIAPQPDARNSELAVLLDDGSRTDIRLLRAPRAQAGLAASPWASASD